MPKPTTRPDPDPKTPKLKAPPAPATILVQNPNKLYGF